MYWIFNMHHARSGFGRLIKDFGNDLETFFVLNKSKIRMLRPPKLGGVFVNVLYILKMVVGNEEVSTL
jgi:hypothetical protein